MTPATAALRTFLFAACTFAIGLPSSSRAQELAAPAIGPRSAEPSTTIFASVPPEASRASLPDSDPSDPSTVERRPWHVFTVAGTGELGFRGDGGLATKARLWFAANVAVDLDGNIFIADSFNNRVRRVDARTGTIATVAGTGEQGYSGDGDRATDARLNSPSAVVLDRDGNLLIADTFNNRIRIVDARTGIISTIAGTGEAGARGDDGLAVAAQLTEPAGLALDPSGNLLIADRGNHRVRKLDRESHIITTIAGIGNAGALGDGGPSAKAELNGPTALAIDAQGNIVVADTFNNRIRRIDHATGIISTVAGTGEEGFDGDGGPAKAAKLMQPSGIAIDSDGTLLIADTYNNRIRRVDAKTGIISTLAGTDARGQASSGVAAELAPLNAPMGLARDPAGNLVVADSGNHSVLRIMP